MLQYDTSLRWSSNGPSIGASVSMVIYSSSILWKENSFIFYARWRQRMSHWSKIHREIPRFRAKMLFRGNSDSNSLHFTVKELICVLRWMTLRERTSRWDSTGDTFPDKDVIPWQWRVELFTFCRKRIDLRLMQHDPKRKDIGVRFDGRYDSG